MPVDAVELEKVPLKCQLPTRSSAAEEKSVSFWVIGITLAIFLLFSVACRAGPHGSGFAGAALGLKPAHRMPAHAVPGWFWLKLGQ